MSVTKQTTLWCDICAAWIQESETAEGLRKLVKSRGWTRYRGQDLCPVCSVRKTSETAEDDEGQVLVYGVQFVTTRRRRGLE